KRLFDHRQVGPPLPRPLPEAGRGARLFSPPRPGEGPGEGFRPEEHVEAAGSKTWFPHNFLGSARGSGLAVTLPRRGRGNGPFFPPLKQREFVRTQTNALRRWPEQAPAFFPNPPAAHLQE